MVLPHRGVTTNFYTFDVYASSNKGLILDLLKPGLVKNLYDPSKSLSLNY